MRPAPSQRLRPLLSTALLAWIALLTLLAKPPLAQAAVAAWTPLGPDGGVVSIVTPSPVDPLVVYAGTPQNGVFRSTDGGRSWTAASGGLGSGGFYPLIYALAVDPRNPNVVFLGTYLKTFRSADGGRSWAPGTALPTTGRGNVALSLSFDPILPDTLYVGTAGGVFRTRDGGRTWTPRRDGMVRLAVQALGFNPADGSFYAGLQNGFVYRSVDQGGRWRRANPIALPPILSLGFDPRSPNALLASTSLGLFRSLSFGRAWSQIAGSLISGWVPTVGFQTATERFYAATQTGVFASHDRGASWSRVPGALGAPSVVCFAIGRDALFAGTSELGRGGELRRSADGGASWQSATRGLSVLTPRQLAFDPNDPAILYTTAGRAGLFRSRDAGATWSRLPFAPEDPGLEVTGVAIAPSPPNPLFVGTADNSALLRSDDGGATFTRLAHPALGAQFSVLTPDPRYPTGLWAGGLGTALHSTDGGEHWDRIVLANGIEPWITDIVVDPADSRLVTFAGAKMFVGGARIYYPLLFRSEDGGATWRDQTPAGVPFGGIWRFAADRSVPGTFYVVANTLVLRSVDHGATWNTILDRGGSIGGILSTPDGIYASPAGTVVRSTDQGAHWIPVRAGLGGRNVTNLWLDPANEHHLLAATVSGGLYEFTEAP